MAMEKREIKAPKKVKENGGGGEIIKLAYIFFFQIIRPKGKNLSLCDGKMKEIKVPKKVK